MPSIKNLEMAEALSNDNRVEIKKSLFGSKAVYSPTQSALELSITEFTPDNGGKMERLMALPLAQLRSELASKGAPASTAVGQYRLETAVSKDHAFAAAQLFRFSGFSYQKVSELLICEGADVDIVERLLNGNR